jgi:hypothetical protein
MYNDQEFESLRRDRVICKAISKGKFKTILDKCREEKNIIIKGDYNKTTGYSGVDIELFNNLKNWYPWVKELHDMIFTKHGTIKPSDSRKIIYLNYTFGNNGKSIFFKFLYNKYESNIGLLSVGTSSQLKSSIISLGYKKVYLIDLPRTEDLALNGLMNAVKILKNGLINSAMYGKTNIMMMDPPWVILVGNSRIPMALFTPDRCKVFNINQKH